jgi:protein-S-isoprenylcysteine O-methyltransferase Ste14
MAKKQPASAKASGAGKAGGDDRLPRLSRHPRAQRQIREAKAWAGLAGFVLVALLSVQAGVPLFDAGVRALAWGIGCYVVAWAVAVAVWRHLARAEVAVARQRLTGERPSP